MIVWSVNACCQPNRVGSRLCERGTHAGGLCCPASAPPARCAPKGVLPRVCLEPVDMYLGWDACSRPLLPCNCSPSSKCSKCSISDCVCQRALSLHCIPCCPVVMKLSCVVMCAHRNHPKCTSCASSAAACTADARTKHEHVLRTLLLASHVASDGHVLLGFVPPPHHSNMGLKRRTIRSPPLGAGAAMKSPKWWLSCAQSHRGLRLKAAAKRCICSFLDSSLTLVLCSLELFGG